MSEKVINDGLKVAKKFACKKDYQSHGGEPVIFKLYNRNSVDADNRPT